MTTIDKLDIGIYIQYARRTQMIDDMNRQIRLQEADTIPAQLQLLNIYAKPSEMDILLGVITVTTPWAYFFPPKNYSLQRRSPFTFAQIAPIFTIFGDDEKESDEDKLNKLACSSPDEEEEKKTMIRCLQNLKKINSWMTFVVGRMGQFLQG
jgi:hypothetical protein